MAGSRHILTKKTAPYIFISPFFILFAIFMVYPIIYSVVLSFHDVKQLSQLSYIGLDNYKLLFDTPRFYRALSNTTYYAVGMCLLNVIIGFVIALMLTWKHVPGTSIYRTSVFLPVLVSTVIAGAVFRLILVDTEGGFLNYLIGHFGMRPQNWLDSPRWALKSVLALGFWRSLGLSTVYFIGGFQGLPDELYEAAHIDGASPMQQLWYLTIPLMRPIIAFVSIVTLIQAYLVFTEVFVLNPSGGSARDTVVTLGYYLYESAFRFFKLGYGASVGVVMTLIIVVLSILQLKLLGVFQND
ncbi:MAG: sugar ABC transporter permease [Firmicutes bacterium]|nr:sugar ABC transporter permease [Bacillota bacterium]